MVQGDWMEQKSHLHECLPHFVCVLNCFGRVRLFVTLCTVTHQAPLSMEFSRQEYWSYTSPSLNEDASENLLAVQWLRLHTSTAGGAGSIPGLGN